MASALLALLSLLPLQAAAADWGYRVRPGDTLWDLGERYLKPSVRWQQLQQHNGIDDPYRLPPGQRLGFPVAWLRVEPAPARVLAVRPPAQLRPAAGGAPRELRVGDLLRAGDHLLTGGNASLTLEFADASRLQLREHSELRLDRLSRYGHTGMVDTRLRLQQGRASNRVTPATGPASHYILDAPTATSSVRGTVFRVSAGHPGEAAATEVIEGRVQVGNRHGQRLLVPGQASRSPDSDAAPQPARALLPAPVALPGQRLDPLPLLLEWSPVAGAARYRIDVVQADTPEILLYTATTEDTRLRVPSLSAGALRLLLRAVDADGVEGIDASEDFHVRDQPPPPLTLTPVFEQQLNSLRPRFEWSQVPDAAGSVLQLATDADFRQVLVQEETGGTRLRAPQALPPGRYYWRVASRSADGHLGSFGQALPLTLTDAPVDPGLQPPQAEGSQLTVRWQAGEAGSRYRVQVDRNGDFRRPLLDTTVEQPQASFRRPWQGTLHVRVQYIADDGHAEPFSPAQQVRLPCRSCAVLGGAALLLLLP